MGTQGNENYFLEEFKNLTRFSDEEIKDLTKESCSGRFVQMNLLELDNIWLFKVEDYTGILLGRFDKANKRFFVQLSDSTRYNYAEDRVTWKMKIEVVNL